MRHALPLALIASLCAGCGLVVDFDPPDPVAARDGGFDASARDAALGDARIDQSVLDATLDLDASDLDASGLDASSFDAGYRDAGERDAGVIEVDGGPCPAGCDDGVACTVDTCAPIGCQHVPNDLACPAPGGLCRRAVCESTGCGVAITPLAPCSDGNGCTLADTCTTAGVCDGTPKICGTGFLCEAPSGTCRCTGMTCAMVCLPAATCCPGTAAGSCGMCGTLRCRSDGSGYDCSDQHGVCSPGGCYVDRPGACSGACPVGQSVTCNADCNWGGCYG